MLDTLCVELNNLNSQAVHVHLIVLQFDGIENELYIRLQHIFSVMMIATIGRFTIDNKFTKRMMKMNFFRIYCNDLCIMVDIKYISIKYQSCISIPLATCQSPFKFPSISYLQPFTYPYPTPQQEHNYQSCLNFIFTIDSTVSYWFSDAYLHRIDSLLHTTVKRTCKLTRFLLETSLSMAKQLEYWCGEICNVIQSWILFNYRLVWINIVTVCYIMVMFDMIRCISIIWIRIDAMYINCIHKLYINVRCSYNLDQNKVIGYS